MVPDRQDRGLDSRTEASLVRAISSRPEIQEAYLFGSRATGATQAHSDIDIAVWVDPAALPGGAFGYAAELAADLMAAAATNAIDVVVLNRAPPVLYHRVLRDGRRLVARDARATTTREGYALSRYCDFQPQLAKIEAARART
jgi:predicted nucleotidyltransferase